MKPAFFACAVFLPLLLAGCGVPDLIAHGVKSYEATQDKSRQYDASQPAPQSQPATYTPAQPQTIQPEPQPVAVETVPPRETVTAEPLR